MGEVIVTFQLALFVLLSQTLLLALLSFSCGEKDILKPPLLVLEHPMALQYAVLLSFILCNCH